MALSLISDLSSDDLSLLQDAWKHWGMDLQIDVFEEELSELGEAITLAHMDGAHWSNGVFEELADVIICTQQIEVCLRAFPTDLEGSRTLWMDVVDLADSTDVGDVSPDNLLLLHALRTLKTFAKTRRVNNGGLLWNFALLSELGGLLRVLLRAEDYLKGVSAFCPHWHRVQEIRAAKMVRLRGRLAVANLGPCEYTINYWCDACGYTHHQEAGPYPDPDEVCPKCGEPLEWEVL